MTLHVYQRCFGKRFRSIRQQAIAYTNFEKSPWCQVASKDHNMLTHLPLDKMAAILADDISKCFFLNEYVWISMNISLKFVPKGSINNIPAMAQILASHRLRDKPLSEPMLTRFAEAYMRHPDRVTHICGIKLCLHRFRQRLIARSAPSNHPNQCQLVVNWTH